jgi:phosphate transport system substrate-binding protein
MKAAPAGAANPFEIETTSAAVVEPDGALNSTAVAKRPMNKQVVSLVLALAGGLAAAECIAQTAPTALAGAGSSARAAVYEGWGLAYGSRYGMALEYAGVGSARGISQAAERNVDFAASDLPLRGMELEKAGLAQFPTVVTAVVPVVNLQGVGPGALRLTGPLLAEILLGRIEKWNDAAIAGLNPNLALPDLDIQVVYRADEAEQTQVLTRYLSKVSEAWAKQVGSGAAVQWKVGTGAKGAAALVGEVKRLRGAIGYVELNQTQEARLAFPQLQNLFGRFVSPEPATLLAAADAVDWARHYAGRSAFGVDLTDMPGLRAWPITAASYVVLPRVQDRPERARVTLAFLDWSLSGEGDQIAEKLGSVGLPAKGKQYVRASLRRSVTDARGDPLLR